jgi:serine/threonine-protein kinase
MMCPKQNQLRYHAVLVELKGGTWVTSGIQLVRRLDEGAMGSVWVGDHLSLGTEVAVKFVTARLADQAVILKRLEAEAKNAARIKSPHVVRTFDFGALEDGTPYIVMELLEGQNLHDRLATGHPLTPREVAIVMTHAARCLHGAHQLGIVHRDIKPENLFLLDAHDEDLFVKVLDFGIAKGLGRSMTQPGTLIGTLPYMSRDRLVDETRLDHRADLWALSVVAYEALTGRLPFDGDTTDEVCAAIWRCKFKPPSEIDPSLNQAIDDWFFQALHRDRAERPASAKHLTATFVRAIATLDGAFRSGEHDDWRVSQLDLAPYVPSSPLPPSSQRPSLGSSLRPISYPGSDPPPDSVPSVQPRDTLTSAPPLSGSVGTDPSEQPRAPLIPNGAVRDTGSGRLPTPAGVLSPMPPEPVRAWRAPVAVMAVALAVAVATLVGARLREAPSALVDRYHAAASELGAAVSDIDRDAAHARSAAVAASAAQAASDAAMPGASAAPAKPVSPKPTLTGRVPTPADTGPKLEKDLGF